MSNDTILTEMIDTYQKHSKERMQDIKNLNRKTNELIEEKDKNEELNDIDNMLKDI